MNELYPPIYIHTYEEESYNQWMGREGLGSFWGSEKGDHISDIGWASDGVLLLVDYYLVGGGIGDLDTPPVENRNAFSFFVLF